MTSIIIKDLSVTTELDARAMADVYGGTHKGYSTSYHFEEGQLKLEPSKSSFSFDIAQQLGQSQNTLVNTGNNSAFASNISANVNPYQNGNNSISFA